MTVSEGSYPGGEYGFVVDDDDDDDDDSNVRVRVPNYTSHSPIPSNLEMRPAQRLLTPLRNRLDDVRDFLITKFQQWT
jgi:hypothetical protein